MASLENRAGKYRVIFRLGGRKFSRSLKTRNEKEANASLARLEDSLRRVELGMLELPSGADPATFLLSDGRVNVRPRVQATLTLKQLLEKFFASIPEGNLEPSTIQGMRVHEKQLIKYLGAQFPIRTLTFSHLQAYADRRGQDMGRRGRRVTPITVRKSIVTLQTVWHWGVQEGLVNGPFPSRGLRFAKTKEKPSFQTFTAVERQSKTLPAAEAADLWDCVFLTRVEIEDLLSFAKKNADHEFLYPMLVFAAHTGARRSEIIRSTADHVDFTANAITIHEKKRVRGQLTTRRVPMSPVLRAVLGEWIRRHPECHNLFCRCNYFPSRITGRSHRPLTPTEANYHLKVTLAESKWARLRGWHVFRHSFCSNCAAAGIDQRVINSWVGHQTEAMVRRYRHLIPDQQQSAIMLVFGGGKQSRIARPA